MTPEDYLKLYSAALPKHRPGEQDGGIPLVLDPNSVKADLGEHYLELAPRAELLRILEITGWTARAKTLRQLEAALRRQQLELDKAIAVRDEQSAGLTRLAQRNDEVYGALKRLELQYTELEKRQAETLHHLKREHQASIAEHQASITELNQRVGRLQAIEQSLSWRVTALWRHPLSTVKRLLVTILPASLTTALQQLRRGVFGHTGPDQALGEVTDGVPRVLVLDAVMTTPDRDSGSVRMFHALGILRELGCKVFFMPSNLDDVPPYGDALREQGVEVVCRPQVESVYAFLHQYGAVLDVVILSRLKVARHFLDLVRKTAPQARLVFDTVDLHYLREEREAELEDSQALRETAANTKQDELGVMQSVDLTFVVSPVEQDVLARESSDLQVEVLSNIHRLHPTDTPFEQRRDLLFIGGFRHPPNVDAMEWFVKDILHLVHQCIPEVRLHIIGSDMPESIHALASEHVVIEGYVEDVTPMFSACRISISPLRYGAGVKGKVNTSMSYGVPVVATSMAAEGMYLTHGEDVMVGDTPQAFADALVRLYTDAELWRRLVNKGFGNIERHFSLEAARAVLTRTLVKTHE